MFSQTVEYALRAMVFLTAHKSTPVSAQVIAAHAYVPERYMSKVMRNLVVAGLVKSRRGPAGGFMLARAPAEISMLSVVEALAPIPRIERCPLANPLHQALCPRHCRLDAAYALIRRVLGQSSLEEVAGDAGFGALNPSMQHNLLKYEQERWCRWLSLDVEDARPQSRRNCGRDGRLANQ